VLWCLNDQWKIKTSFRINPVTDFIEMFTHVWEDIIKTDLRKIILERVDWIRVAQDRDQWRFLTNTAINLMLLSMRGISSVAD
jgi:hypothetical protein